MTTNEHQIKQAILNRVEDLVTDFLYYDRKKDEFITPEMLNDAVATGIITKEEIIAKFSENIIQNWTV